jgi:hypothetical protein
MFGFARFVWARDRPRLRSWVFAAGCALALHGWALIDRSGPAPVVTADPGRPLQVVFPLVVPVDLAAADEKSNPITPTLPHSPVTPTPAAAQPGRSPLTPAPLPSLSSAQAQPEPARAPALAAVLQSPLQAPLAEPLEAAPDEPDPQGLTSADATRVKQVPSYATQLPAEFVLPLQARRLSAASALGEPRPVASGAGELRFERDEQGRYALSLNLQLGARPFLEMRSRGRAGTVGLEPERFTDRRRGRSSAAANFDHETQQARFSAGAAQVPLAAAAQDRLTWLVQLPAVLRADPALTRPGAVVWLQVVGARGGSQVWRFEALGLENLQKPDGTLLQAAWHWRRQPESPYDLQVDVWLADPAAQAPALVRLTPVPGGAALEFWPAS